MKLQHLAVIFIIIILPISLVMSSYINNQIEAIKMQTAYDTNLINATYGAVQAFQINTTNNIYSTVSDSKVRDIEAAVNTFYNSLITSMNGYALSAEDIRQYTPAILFTLYDGYYIYSSYDNVYSIVTDDDGNEKVQITIDGNNYQNGLKAYTYYSAKYKLRNGNVIVVNYTLDNAITVYGDFGNGYVTYSGYLINPKNVTNINTEEHTLMYNGILIEPEILTEHLITIENRETNQTRADDYRYIFYQNEKIYQDQDENGNLLYNEDGTPRIFWYHNYEKTYVNNADIRNYARQCSMMSTSAFDYYYEAYEFSNWVINNLGDITQANLVRDDNNQVLGDNFEYLSENTGSEKIFVPSNTNDPLLSNSFFNNHRLAVIRKSIETSLMTAIENYKSISLYDYAMPIMTDEDWYKILNNISVVSFLQGMSIGFRYYNNYAIITNNVNKELVSAQNIYIVAEDESGNLEYHQAGCKDLIDGVINGNLIITGSYSILGFKRQTAEITEEINEYYYPQARVGKTVTGCYNCIVNATSDYDVDEIISGTITYYEDGSVLYNQNDIAEIRKAYLTALARERYDLYKSNFDLTSLNI